MNSRTDNTELTLIVEEMCRDYTGSLIYIFGDNKMSLTHEVAWAAGFFDGEGYITIQERNSKINGISYRGYYLRIGINHVALEPLLEMQRLFGGTIRLQKEASVVGNRKQRSTWCLSCNHAKEVLIRLMPYLKNKNKVAEIGITFQNTMGNHGQRTTPDQQDYRESLKILITSMNAKD